jgi:hypothetical protein
MTSFGFSLSYQVSVSPSMMEASSPGYGKLGWQLFSSWIEIHHTMLSLYRILL